MKKRTGLGGLSPGNTDRNRLLDFVILHAYKSFWGLSPEQELRLEVLRRQLPSELELGKIRQESDNRDLDQQLELLENYIRNVLDYPYRGDMGVGCSRFMEVRYWNKNRFAALAENFKDSAVSMYVNLWRVILGDLLPKCGEKRQSRLSSVPSGGSGSDRPEIENRILREKYPHFYCLMADQPAMKKCLQGLREFAGVTDFPEVLEPTMNLQEIFGIDSLGACELKTWFEDEFAFSQTDIYPEDDSLGEWPASSGSVARSERFPTINPIEYQNSYP